METLSTAGMHKSIAATIRQQAEAVARDVTAAAKTVQAAAERRDAVAAQLARAEAEVAEAVAAYHEARKTAAAFVDAEALERLAPQLAADGRPRGQSGKPVGWRKTAQRINRSLDRQLSRADIEALAAAGHLEVTGQFQGNDLYNPASVADLIERHTDHPGWELIDPTVPAGPDADLTGIGSLVPQAAAS